MTNVLKKASSLLLSLVMMVTFMPMMAFAGEEAVTPSPDNVEVCISDSTNTDHKVVCYLDSEWFADNTGDDAQIYPWAAGKPSGTEEESGLAKVGVVKYWICKGVDFNTLFSKIGYTADELSGAKIYFCDGEDAYEGPNDRYIDMSIFKDLKYVTKGYATASAQEEGATVVDNRKKIKSTLKKYVEVTPILVTEATAAGGYSTYEDAVAALDEVSLNKTQGVAIGQTGKPYDSTLSKDSKKGNLTVTGPDANGGNNVANYLRINIVMPSVDDIESLALDTSSVNFTSESSKKVTATVTPAALTILNPIEWTTSNNKVATVNDGIITPVGIGECTVTATLGSETKNVTVTVDKKAFTPKTPTKLSAKNVKTKKISVSWKAVNKATGYQVAYKVKGAKKWTVKTASKTSYKTAKLKKGKTYSVKVRAYRTVSGQKVYGSYTSAKNVKIKK